MGRKLGSVPRTWRYVGVKTGEKTVTMDVPLKDFAKAIGVKAYSIRKFPIAVNGWNITRQRWVMEYVLKQDSDND